MIRVAVPTLAAVAALVAGCGGSDKQSSTSSGGKAVTATETAIKDKAAHGTAVKVVRSRYGKVLADRRGQAFYFFAKEKTRRSRCYGACAKAWPPVLTKGRPVAKTGARARLLGTTRRRDGSRQVTYRGHPLYYFSKDSPGKILCQNVAEFGGLWLVIRPSGAAVH